MHVLPFDKAGEDCICAEEHETVKMMMVSLSAFKIFHNIHPQAIGIWSLVVSVNATYFFFLGFTIVQQQHKI